MKQQRNHGAADILMLVHAYWQSPTAERDWEEREVHHENLHEYLVYLLYTTNDKPGTVSAQARLYTTREKAQ